MLPCCNQVYLLLVSCPADPYRGRKQDIRDIRPPKKRQPYAFMRTRSSGAPEPAGTADTLLQHLDLLDLGRDNPLEHQLCDPVPLLDLVVGVGVVEEQHLDLAAVVGVDDARARVDEVLRGEAGAGGDPAVYTPRGWLAGETRTWKEPVFFGQEYKSKKTYTSRRGRPC